MGTIAINNLSVVTPATIVKTTLTASDLLPYNAAKLQTLFLENDTASPVTVTIDGDEATTFVPGGIGAAIDLAAGFQIVVPANGTRAVQLRNIQHYLLGEVAVTGGVGVLAFIVE